MGQDNFEYGRLAQAMNVVMAEGPDILALQELMYANLEGNSALHKIENELGMRSFFAQAKTGQHVAVLVGKGTRVTRSRVDSINFHHASITIDIETSRGPLVVIGTHLCPHGGVNRLGESQRLANAARPDRMVLLMGHLNSLDPWQDHHGRVASLPPQYRSRHLLPASQTEVDTRAVATLANAGFVDLFRHAHTGVKDYTAPTRYGGGEEFSQMRVDYILATQPLAPAGQAVLRLQPPRLRHRIRPLPRGRRG